MSEIIMTLARANLYSFLSAVFTNPPAAELVGELRNGALLKVLGELGWIPDDGLDAGVADFEFAHEELPVAFTRLMVGPGNGYVPPYGSIYLDAPVGGTNPRLWGPSAIAIGQIYEAAGLQLVDGQVPDHLAIELAFLSLLSAREANELAQGDAAAAEQSRQRRLTVLRGHLLCWVASWVEDVTRAAPHRFYQAMARLTAGFLAWDAEASNAPGAEARQVRSRLCVTRS